MSDTPETLARLVARTRARLATFGDSTCTEAVVRRGSGEPCGKPAVALRDDPEVDSYYPVCARHTRGFCIPVMDRADVRALLGAASRLAEVEAERDLWRGNSYSMEEAFDAVERDRDALREAYERLGG